MVKERRLLGRNVQKSQKKFYFFIHYEAKKVFRSNGCPNLPKGTTVTLKVLKLFKSFELFDRVARSIGQSVRVVSFGTAQER
jgi:hypothetical protein